MAQEKHQETQTPKQQPGQDIAPTDRQANQGSRVGTDDRAGNVGPQKNSDRQFQTDMDQE